METREPQAQAAALRGGPDRLARNIAKKPRLVFEARISIKVILLKPGRQEQPPAYLRLLGNVAKK